MAGTQPIPVPNSVKTRELREVKLSAPVSAWMRARGLEVFCEVPFGASAIDIVGVSYNPFYAVAVELKTAFTGKVIHQALLRQLTAHEVYACAPTKPGKRALRAANEYGLGLMRVLDGQVFIHTPAKVDRERRTVSSRYIADLEKMLEHLPKGGDGGKPQLKDVGPRQEVYARVKAYRAENPKATWAEIFKAVPNHYSHAKSMQNVMTRWEFWQRLRAERPTT